MAHTTYNHPGVECIYIYTHGHIYIYMYICGSFKLQDGCMFLIVCMYMYIYGQFP